MRLVDLDPKWLVHDGQRVGFTFFSPTNPGYRQTCFVVAGFGFSQQLKIMQDALGEDCYDWQPCRKDFAWTIEGGIDAATFETMTVTPSLDGSAGGLWHGYITNGVIVGGLLWRGTNT